MVTFTDPLTKGIMKSTLVLFPLGHSKEDNRGVACVVTIEAKDPLFEKIGQNPLRLQGIPLLMKENKKEMFVQFLRIGQFEKSDEKIIMFDVSFKPLDNLQFCQELETDRWWNDKDE